MRDGTVREVKIILGLLHDRVDIALKMDGAQAGEGRGAYPAVAAMHTWLIQATMSRRTVMVNIGRGVLSPTLHLHRRQGKLVTGARGLEVLPTSHCHTC